MPSRRRLGVGLGNRAIKVHPSQTPEATRAYYLAHRDAILARKKAQRQSMTTEQKAAALAKWREWVAANPARRLEIAQASRERCKAAN